ncbi:MAG TPA: hypothetical protein VIU12_02070 [Chryseolinea sp.]
MNNIEEIREENRKYFDGNARIEGSDQVLFSPTKKYRIQTAEYKQTKLDVNWSVTTVEIYEHETGHCIFSFIVNHDLFVHGWLIKNNAEYLVCAEDIYGGQTMIDLSNRRIESYSPGADGFIATDYHLSPDGSILAVVGCYWACPYVLKFFRFDSPMQLPLPEFNEIGLTGKENDKINWVGNETIRFYNIKSGEQHFVKVVKGNPVQGLKTE